LVHGTWDHAFDRVESTTVISAYFRYLSLSSVRQSAAPRQVPLPLVPPRGRAAFEEHAQNGARRETVPNTLGGARRTLCASEEHAQTECGAGQFLTDLAVRAAPFALLNLLKPIF